MDHSGLGQTRSYSASSPMRHQERRQVVRNVPLPQAIKDANLDCTMLPDDSAELGTRDGVGGALLQLHRESREVETLVPAEARRAAA